MRAKVVSFYGFSDRDVKEMPYVDFIDYWKCITPIEAQNYLMLLKINAYPKLKASPRKQFFSTLEKLTKANLDSGKRNRNLSDIAQGLASKLNG